MKKIPYFNNFGDIHGNISILEVLKYLREYDDNLGNDKLANTISSIKDTFKQFTVKDILLLRQAGHGIITEGYLKSAKLIDGFKAINRRGYFQIMGDADIVDIPNLSNGKIVKSLQAPVLYTAGRDQQIYADVVNVGPLVNAFSFGFDFSDHRKPHLVKKLQDFDEKMAFLKTIKEKVIYVLEQFTLEDDSYKNRYGYYPKHTVWLIFPNSLFLFLHSLQEPVLFTEKLAFCRSDK